MSSFQVVSKTKLKNIKIGQLIGEDVINMKQENIIKYFENGVRALTGLSLGINLPNTLSVPHMIGNAFGKLLALGVASGYEFKQLKAALAAGANAPVQAQTTGQTEVAAPVEAEPEEAEANISAGGLFGDDDSDSDD